LPFKKLTDISSLRIDKNRFKAFFLLSAIIHLSFLVAVPLSVKKKAPPKPKLFNVNLVKKKPEIHKKTPPKIKNDIKQQLKTKTKAKAHKLKKTVKDKLALKREATISLNTRDAKYTSYLTHLKQKINTAWQYPAIAKKNKIEGELTLCFSLGSDGRLLDIKIINPSGHDILDRGSISAVENAGPFNPFPEKLKLSKLNIISTFIYQFEAD